MLEFFACSAAALASAGLWLAAYKFGGLGWNGDPSLAGFRRELSGAHLTLDDEMHDSAERPSSSGWPKGGKRAPLFNALAVQARLSVPA